MSERFDDLMAGLVDAASAHPAPGPTSARKRGRKRRNRQRLAASTLSLALLGAVGGVAATTMHSSNGVASASATDTVTATPNLTASPSPAGSPSASPSGGPTGTNSGSPGADASTTANASTVRTADPGTYVAGAWLTVEQMPLYQAGVTTWAYDAFNYGTHLGGHVYRSPAGHLTNWCDDVMSSSGNLTSLEDGLTGSQYQAFTGPNSDKILPNGTIPYITAQTAYFYHSVADAQAAMNGLATDFANCATKTTGTNPTSGFYVVGSAEQTLAQTGAQCWSLLGTAKSPTPNSGSLDHDCFVQAGSVIEEVHLLDNEDGSFTTQSFTATDSALIPELQHNLQAYPGS